MKDDLDTKRAVKLLNKIMEMELAGVVRQLADAVAEVPGPPPEPVDDEEPSDAEPLCEVGACASGGVATAAVGAFTVWAQANFGLRRLTARVFAGNEVELHPLTSSQGNVFCSIIL